MGGTNRRFIDTCCNQWIKIEIIDTYSKLATLDKTLIKGRIGKLTLTELQDLDEKLKKV